MYRHSFVLHTVIQTSVKEERGASPTINYYEVVSKVYNGYELAQINPASGATMGFCKAADGHPLVGLGLVAPTHPVYIKWAQRRLADRLEGLDRT